jgi:hypothetical protein
MANFGFADHQKNGSLSAPVTSGFNSALVAELAYAAVFKTAVLTGNCGCKSHRAHH